MKLKKINQKMVQKAAPEFLGLALGAVAVGLLNKKVPEFAASQPKIQTFITNNPWALNVLPIAIGGYVALTAKPGSLQQGIGYGMVAVGGQKTLAGFGIGTVDYLGEIPDYIEVEPDSVTTVNGPNYLGEAGGELSY